MGLHQLGQSVLGQSIWHSQKQGGFVITRRDSRDSAAQENDPSYESFSHIEGFPREKIGGHMVNVRVVVEDSENDLRNRIKVTWPQVIRAGLRDLAKKKRGTRVHDRTKKSK